MCSIAVVTCSITYHGTACARAWRCSISVGVACRSGKGCTIAMATCSPNGGDRHSGAVRRAGGGQRITIIVPSLLSGDRRLDALPLRWVIKRVDFIFTHRRIQSLQCSVHMLLNVGHVSRTVARRYHLLAVLAMASAQRGAGR